MNQAPQKSLGQHWLHDKESLEAMCDAAEVKAGDTVLEIGPGTGTLSDVLLRRGAGVIAVELDEHQLKNLQKKFEGQDFELHYGNILKFDLSQLPAGYKIVANIPYYLTSHLIRILSETNNPPKRASMLVQKEVAERVTAQSGQMSLLSVTAQFYWEAGKGKVVPARLFTPPPKVDSQILILKHRAKPLFSVNENQFFRVVKAGFANRRKTLLNSLSAGLRITKAEADQVLKQAEIDAQARAQELSLEQWNSLYKNLGPELK